jgi:hypothetical protein
MLAAVLLLPRAISIMACCWSHAIIWGKHSEYGPRLIIPDSAKVLTSITGIGIKLDV